jgi:hypothetical protein
MARNLVLAPLLKLSPQLQDSMYLDHWVSRVENLFPSQEELNAGFIKYIEEKKGEVTKMSEFETMFTKMHKQLSGGDRFTGLLQYSKFVSIYEHIQDQVARGCLHSSAGNQNCDLPVDVASTAGGNQTCDLPEDMASTDLRTSLCVIDSLQLYFTSSTKY